MKKWEEMQEEEETSDDIYSEKTREVLLEDDEISNFEAAFMEGYDNA